MWERFTSADPQELQAIKQQYPAAKYEEEKATVGPEGGGGEKAKLYCRMCDYDDKSLLVHLGCKDHSCCLDCWASYIKTVIEGQNAQSVLQIRCIFGKSCGRFLPLNDMPKLLRGQPPALLKSFYALVERQFVVEHPNFVYCTACGAVLRLHKKKNELREKFVITCKACSTSFANFCNCDESHMSLTCEQNLNWIPRDALQCQESRERIIDNEFPQVLEGKGISCAFSTLV